MRTARASPKQQSAQRPGRRLRRSATGVSLPPVPEEAPELYLQLLSKTMRWRMKGQSLAELREQLATVL